MWEHENGIRGVWDITLAPDMYLRSDYYTNDERWEITGRRGYARVNRCTGRGIQQPSLEIYIDGEMRSFHALDDDWASSFRDSGRHWLRWLHTGDGPLLWSGEEAVDVLRFALAVYASSRARRYGRRTRVHRLDHSLWEPTTRSSRAISRIRIRSTRGCRARSDDLIEVPERGVFVAARHDVVRTVLRDHTTYRSGLGVQWIPVAEAGLRATFIENDPPAHTRVRRSVQKWCTPSAMSELASVVDTIVDELVDAFVTGRGR